MEDGDGSTGDIYITYENGFLSNNVRSKKSRAEWVSELREGEERLPSLWGGLPGVPLSACGRWGGVSHLT